MQTRILLTALIATALGAPAVSADGQHHARFYLKNGSGNTLKLRIYNGDDAVCIIPHRKVSIPPGIAYEVRCHGKGKKLCHYDVEALGSQTNCHKNADGQDVRCAENDKGKIDCRN